ncbi:hypothetical protein EUTSA_v10003477mg, partial [Eutrema salsugineum]
MVHQWKTHGYTHQHYGAIWLALTLHGRKGLPIVARVALLDTRYREYQHACVATIQTTLNAGTSFIYKRKDGAIEISFKQLDGEKPRQPGFCTEINAISPAEEVQPLRQYLPGVPINKFNAAGDPIYAFSDKTGHKVFDVCDCDYCLMSSSDEEEKPRRRKKKSSQQILKERYECGGPKVGNIRSSWKIRNTNVKNPDAAAKQVSAAEATLNWQSKNFMVQNHLLSQIDRKVSILDLSIKEINKRISSLHQELLHLATTVFTTSPLMYQKESELRSLKAQLQSLQNQPKTQTPMPYNLFTPYPIYSPPAMTQTKPLSFSHDPSIFGSSSFLPTRIKEQRPTKKKHPAVPKETPKISALENTKTTAPEKIEAEFMVEHAKNPISLFLEQMAEQTKPPKQQSSVKSLMTLQESSDEEFIIPNFMMAEPTVEEEDMESDGGNISEDRREPQRPQTPPDWNPRSHTDSHSGFSFDNVPPSKWRDKIYEMLAWLTEQLLNPGATLPTVIDKLISKFHGRLRQWWTSLGDYRELQIRQSHSVDTVIEHIHNEFLGMWDHYTIQAREEYMSMRCCSFKRKDLEKHYERMSKRLYALNGIDDVNHKQAYLNQLPEPLGNETSRILSLKNMTLSQASLGEIYQISLAALEKLCNHQKFFKQLQEQGTLLGRACDRPELSIKCKKKRCGCSTSYKQEKKSRNKWEKRYPKLSGGKKWKFFRRKKQRGYKKSDRCYICKNKGHYAKQRPNKKKRDNLLGYLAQ